MRERAAGLEKSAVSPIDAPDEVKSVSNERTFTRDLTDLEDVLAAIELLSESVGERLRRRSLAGRTVTLKLKFSFGEGRSAQRRLAHPTDDENVFGSVACELMRDIWQPGMRVRLAGVGVSDFGSDAAGIQTDLFCEVDERGAVASDRRTLCLLYTSVLRAVGILATDELGGGQAVLAGEALGGLGGVAVRIEGDLGGRPAQDGMDLLCGCLLYTSRCV